MSGVTLTGTELRQHPDYHEGFADATAGEPLHYGMSAEYRWGWIGAYRCKRALKKMFSEEEKGRISTAPSSYTP